MLRRHRRDRRHRPAATASGDRHQVSDLSVRRGPTCCRRKPRTIRYAPTRGVIRSIHPRAPARQPYAVAGVGPIPAFRTLAREACRPGAVGGSTSPSPLQIAYTMIVWTTGLPGRQLQRGSKWTTRYCPQGEEARGGLRGFYNTFVSRHQSRILRPGPITSPDRFWFYWPMIGWGIGLAIHAVSVFGPRTCSVRAGRAQDPRVMEKERARPR